MQEIIRDSSVYSVDSVTIVEVMGRHAGWLTASSCVLRANGEIAPHLIYLPENALTEEKFISDLKEAKQVHKAVIVAVSEGVKLERANSDANYGSGEIDSFGHEALSGIGKVLENIVRERIGCKVRSIELNVMQRCSSHISSKADIDEAELIGAKAVEVAVKGESGKVVIFKRLSNTPYTVIIDTVNASDIANKERFFPKKWINAKGNNVLDSAVEYFLPLIQGEQIIRMKNGIPIHFHI